MNLTFLIGNGFDLNAGLKTRYTDFLRDYLEQVDDDDRIKTFKQHIRLDVETWGDAEAAFGQYTGRYDAAQWEEFRACYDDFCLKLSRYLDGEQETLNMKENNDLVETAMRRALQEFPSFLRRTSQVKLEQRLRRFAHETYQYRFINFNYTTVFDQCLSTLGEENDVFGAHRRENVSGSNVLRELVHVHGTTRADMILGVNDESQVSNREMLTIRRFARQFIKPNANESLKQENDALTRNIIANSHIICVYGMSLGRTDAVWWRALCDWLRKDQENQLVLFVRREDFIPTLTSSFLDAEEEVEERFFSYSALEEPEREALREQLHVAVNADLFPFRLTDETSAAALQAAEAGTVI